jgi:hypothetical protein
VPGSRHGSRVEGLGRRLEAYRGGVVTGGQVHPTSAVRAGRQRVPRSHQALAFPDRDDHGHCRQVDLDAQLSPSEREVVERYLQGVIAALDLVVEPEHGRPPTG